MRNQVFACLLAVSVLLMGGRAEALAKGWYIKETATRATIYNHEHTAVWTGYFDEFGVWHEITHSPRRPSGGETGETMGEVRASPDHVLVEIAKPVEGILVIDPSRKEVVFELRGGLEAGSTVKIPAAHLGDTVQLLATVGGEGTTLDVVSFKRMGACGEKSFWLSR